MDYQLNVFRVVKQLKSNAYVPPHSHSGYYQYLYVIGGSGFVVCDGAPYEAGEGTLFLFRPGVEHSITGIKDFNSIDIKFECDGPLAELINFDRNVLPNLSEYERSLIREIFDEAALGKYNSNHLINALMLTFLMVLVRRVNSSDAIRSERAYLAASVDKEINAALTYIDRNITTPISISQLARSIGYSPSYFSTIFKLHTGYIPSQYINLKRIDLAKKLMLTTKMNITEISEYLGFDSLHYFSRTFKKIVGLAPRYYYNRINNSAGISIIDGVSHFSTDQFQFELHKGAADSPDPEEPEALEGAEKPGKPEDPEIPRGQKG